jgi:hypothetical protein
MLKNTKMEINNRCNSTFILLKLQTNKNISAMKSFILGLIILLPLLSLANPLDIKNTPYYICHFDTQITEEIILELEVHGFEVMKRDHADHVVYVKSSRQSNFSDNLQENMNRLVHVDEQGDQHILLEEQPNSSTPQYLKVFFNFIP